VFTEGPQNDKYAIATPAGDGALDALASDIGLQTGLGDFENEGVSETLQSKVDPCNDAQAREGGPRTRTNPQRHRRHRRRRPPGGRGADATDQPAESGGRSHSSGFAPVETPLSGSIMPPWRRRRRAVWVWTMPLGGVNNAAFEEWTVTRQDDNRSPIYSYNDSRDELVVGADWHGPLQYTGVRRKGVIEPARVRAGAYARPAGREGRRAISTPC